MVSSLEGSEWSGHKTNYTLSSQLGKNKIAYFGSPAELCCKRFMAASTEIAGAPTLLIRAIASVLLAAFWPSAADIMAGQGGTSRENETTKVTS